MYCDHCEKDVGRDVKQLKGFEIEGKPSTQYICTDCQALIEPTGLKKPSYAQYPCYACLNREGKTMVDGRWVCYGCAKLGTGEVFDQKRTETTKIYGQPFRWKTA